MHKINFNQSVVNLDGEILKKDPQTPIIIKDIVANALCVAKPLRPEGAIHQLSLAIDIYKSTEEITVEDADVELIKTILNKTDLTTLVLGQILKLLQ